jgi:hypothetical protein
MTQHEMLGPVFAMCGLTFAVWVFMYVKRIRFINANGISPTDMAVPGALAAISPPDVVNPSDNFKNLFEMPVLFYVLATLLIATDRVDSASVVAAWVFVVFRVLHSVVHCTVNVVLVRFYLYLASSLALWFIAARAALTLLGG